MDVNKMYINIKHKIYKPWSSQEWHMGLNVGVKKKVAQKLHMSEIG